MKINTTMIGVTILGLISAYYLLKEPEPDMVLPKADVSIVRDISSSRLVEMIKSYNVPNKSVTSFSDFKERGIRKGDRIYVDGVIDRLTDKIALSDSIQERAYQLYHNPGNETRFRLNRLYHNAETAYRMISKIKINHYSRMIREGDTLRVSYFDDGKLYNHGIIFGKGGGIDEQGDLKERTLTVTTELKDKTGTYKLSPITMDYDPKDDFSIGDILGITRNMVTK